MSNTWIEPLTLTVGKSATVQISEYEWKKVRYELQINVTGAQNKDDLDHVRDLAEKMIDAWINKQNKWQPSPEATEQAHKLAGIPDLDESELLTLPFWVGKRQGGHAAGEFEGGWLGRDPRYLKDSVHKQLLARLDEAIRKSKGTFEFGRFKYSYSGARQQYITRKPVKEESARQ